MIGLKFYKIITYLLLPIAAVFSVMALYILLVAFGIPQMRVQFFLITCTVFYVFGVYKFIQKAIISSSLCKPFLRDWIKVNAVVSALFALLGIVKFVQIKSNPSLVQNTLQQAEQMQPTNPNFVNAMPIMQQILNFTIWFMLILSLFLIVHIILSFRYLRLFKHSFEAE